MLRWRRRTPPGDLTREGQIELLKTSVTGWNAWREATPYIKPDLLQADLQGANLKEADLASANLQGAYFYEARLQGANLRGADLREAKFYGANLRGANLQGADLQEADLGVDLQWANLAEANLKGADLRWAHLVKARLTKATLTAAKLYGTARDDWDISDVRCHYVFWDEGGKQRSPADRDLEPGEFERVYASLPTIEYVFKDGLTPLDPLIMNEAMVETQRVLPDSDIHLHSIEARGLSPNIKFTVREAEHREPALVEITRRYEQTVQDLRDSRNREALLRELMASALQAPHISFGGDVKLLGQGAVDSSVTAGGNAANVVTGENSSASADDIEIGSTPQPPEQESRDATE